MEISNAMSRCFKNDIKVYPVSTKKGWMIRCEILGKKTTFQKVLYSKKEINQAIEKTYFYLCGKYC